MLLSKMGCEEEVRNGDLGKTAMLWMSYMDHVWLVFTLLQAVKNNDFEAYCHCLYEMCDLFFSFGGHNYARYLLAGIIYGYFYIILL